MHYDFFFEHKAYVKHMKRLVISPEQLIQRSYDDVLYCIILELHVFLSAAPSVLARFQRLCASLPSHIY